MKYPRYSEAHIFRYTGCPRIWSPPLNFHGRMLFIEESFYVSHFMSLLYDIVRQRLTFLLPFLENCSFDHRERIREFELKLL